MARIVKSVFIPRPAAEVYEAWRRFDGFSPFTRLAAKGNCSNSLQTLSGPALRHNVAVLEDVPATRIVWQRAEGASHSEGFVEFIPAEGGCVLVVVLSHKPMGGILGAVLAKILDHPGMQIEEDVNRFCAFVAPADAEPAREEVALQGQRRLGFFGASSR